jgi:hypothetical protein
MPYVLTQNQNLVTYYLLPLVGVNKTVFGRKFVNSYLDPNSFRIYVHISSEMESIGHSAGSSYISEAIINKKRFVIYEIEKKYLADVELFLAGKYSKFKRSTKKIIYVGSSLPYNKSIGDFKMTSPIIQALDNTQILRDHLLSSIGIKTLPDSAELIDLPNESWFIHSQI